MKVGVLANKKATINIVRTMARRPDSEKPEVFTKKELDELRYNLVHLSVDAVRRFYCRAHEDCRNDLGVMPCRRPECQVLLIYVLQNPDIAVPL